MRSRARARNQLAGILHLEAGFLEDGVVVSPAGVADEDQAARAVHCDELRGDAQRAGAGERLHDGDSLLLDEGGVGAEDDLCGLCQERLQALRWRRRGLAGSERR